jgi:polar amino acid transport system substrate-binding protein
VKSEKKRPMMRMKSILSSAVVLAALAFHVVPAQADAGKCEPDKLATKYPALAGKTIRIGQDGESPPYSYRDPKNFDNLIGLDADMARAVFACIGAPIEFKTGAWSGLLPAVIAGQLDVMWDTLYYTPERAKSVDFVSYMIAATGGLVAKGNPKSIKSLDDVCGKRATAGLGTVEEEAFRDLSKKCVAAGKGEVAIVTYPDVPGGTRLISNDRADVLMSDLGMVSTLVKNNPDQFDRGFMIVTNFKIAAGYTKDNKDLGQALLDALTILRVDGTEQKMFEKYGVDYALAQPSQILTK